MSFYKLLPHQVGGVDFLTSRPNAALLAEQGTGKTVMAVKAINRLDVPDVLCVVPLTNIETTWENAVRLELPAWTVCRSIDEYQKARGKRVLLLHYEAVPALIKKLRRIRWGLVLYDEAQRIKERATLASRRAYMLRNSERRWALTGTPLDDDPSDLWAIMRFVDTRCFGDRWADFDKAYMRQPTIDIKKYRPGSVMFQRMQMALRIQKRKLGFDFDKLPQFMERLRPYALRIGADVMNLPALRVHNVPVMMTGTQARVYDDMERDFVVKLRSSRTMAALRLTQIVKLQQIAGGYLIDDDGETHRLPGAKARKLNHILNQLARWPVVIFCKYREELEICREVVERYTERVEVLYGKVKDKKNDKARTSMLQRFQAGETDCLIVQVKTGGVGVDLFRSNFAIAYSLPWSFIDYDQMRKRFHRYGQESDCDLFLLTAYRTIDEDILTAIDTKSKVNEVVVKRLTNSNQEKEVMAKEAKAKPAKNEAPKNEAPATEKKKSNLPAKPEYKYTAANLAEALGLEPATVRIALRKHKVAKANGGVYGWDKKTDFDEVVKLLKGDKAEKKAKDKKAA
jgi:SNF2 family DNA or RNA helicase